MVVFSIECSNSQLGKIEKCYSPPSVSGGRSINFSRSRNNRRISSGSISCRTTRPSCRERINPAAIKYINRLSDYLFVLGRHVNDNGASDVMWVPGANRK